MVSSRSSLSWRIAVYFILVVVLSVFIAAEILFDLQTVDFASEQSTHLVTKKVIVGMAMHLYVSCVIFIMLAKRVTKPLEQLLDSVRVLAHGDLRAEFNTKDEGEYGDVASSLEELASNIHELVIIEQRMTRLLSDLAKAAENNADVGELRRRINEVRNLQLLLDAVLAFIKIREDPIKLESQDGLSR